MRDTQTENLKWNAPLGTSSDVAASNWLKRLMAHYWIAGSLLALAYFASGMLGLALPFDPQSKISLVWPPSGIAVAVLWRFGLNLWPWVFVGALAINLATGCSAVLSIVLAASNVPGLVLAAHLMHRMGFDSKFSRRHDVGVFCAATGVGMLLPSTLGLPVLCAYHMSAWTDFGSRWVMWFLGDIIGTWSVAPFLLAFRISEMRRMLFSKPVEFLVLVAAVMLISGIFWVNPGKTGITLLPSAFLAFPLLVWAGLKLGATGASLSVLLISSVAVVFTAAGKGPFHLGSHDEQAGLLLLGSFMCTASFLSLLTTALGAERHQVEEELLDSERRFRTMAEACPDSIVVVESISQELRTPILYANAAACRIHERSKSELTRVCWEDLQGGSFESIQGVRAKLSTLKLGELFTYSGFHRRRDGSVFGVETTAVRFRFGGQEAILCIDRDQTMHHQSERTLQTLVTGLNPVSGSGLLRSLVESAAVTFGVRSAFVGRVIEGRDCFLQALAVWEGNRIRENWTYPLQGTPCEMVIRHGTEFYPQRVQQLFPTDLHLRKAEAESYLGIRLIDSMDRVVGVLAVIHSAPLTPSTEREALLKIFAYRAAAELERIALEEQKTDLELRLNQSHKMDALGTMAAGIAHDFSNLLGVIQGNAEFATHHLDPGHPALVCIDEVRRAGDRARRLVQQILTYSRPDSKARRVIPLIRPIQDALRVLRALIPSEVTLVSSLDISSPTVLADPIQIEQILMNLVTNAWHALKAGNGKIEVILDTVESDPKAGTMQRFARIVVQDNGSGIAPEIRSKIFDPFFTTKVAGSGVGLGLSIVQSIVTNQRGRIHVQSELGKGTRIEIWLPEFLAEEGSSALADTPRYPEGKNSDLVVPRKTQTPT